MISYITVDDAHRYNNSIMTKMQYLNESNQMLLTKIGRINMMYRFISHNAQKQSNENLI